MIWKQISTKNACINLEGSPPITEEMWPRAWAGRPFADVLGELSATDTNVRLLYKRDEI